VGVYDVVTELNTAVTDNLATQIAAVATAKSKTVNSAFTIYLHERAETFYKRTLPGVGIWVRTTQTGAKRSARRDWNVTLVLDYLAKAKTRLALGEQIGLVMDAMMRMLDDVAGTGTIMGVAEEEFTTAPLFDIEDLLQEAAGISERGPFIAGFRLSVPIRQRDEL